MPFALVHSSVFALLAAFCSVFVRFLLFFMAAARFSAIFLEIVPLPL